MYADIQPSPGCLNAANAVRHYHFPLGRTVRRNLTVTDRNNLTVDRHFWIHRPTSFDPAKPLPLMLYLHGQSGNGKNDLPPYVAIAEREGFIVLSGQGLGEDEDCGSGWNVGATGDDSTCTREAWSSYGANATCCYPSCQALGRCKSGESTWTHGSAHCGWGTCFEDLDFFKLLEVCAYSVATTHAQIVDKYHTTQIIALIAHNLAIFTLHLGYSKWWRLMFASTCARAS